MIETQRIVRHKRRHSWPPVRLTKKTRPARQPEQNINDNPFPFFISPANEPQSFLFDHVDAGIEGHSLKSSRTALSKTRRPVRRWKQRAQAQKAVARLKVWMRRMEKLYRNEPPIQIVEIAPPPVMLLEQMGLPEQLRRSTDDERSESPERPQRPVPRRMRSHSARPRSWIEPHADLFTVPEDDESESNSLGRSVPLMPTPSYELSRPIFV